MILMQGTLLSDYSESEEIEIMEEDILAMANSFEDDGFRAEVSDINFLMHIVFMSMLIF